MSRWGRIPMREGRPPPSADSRERERDGWMGKGGRIGGNLFFLLFFSLRPPPPGALSTTAPALSPSPPPLARLGGFFHQPRCGRHRKEGEEVVLFLSALKKSLHLNLGEVKREEASHSPPPPRRPIAVLKVESGGGREKPFRLLRKLHPACFGHRHQHQRAS